MRVDRQAIGSFKVRRHSQCIDSLSIVEGFKIGRSHGGFWGVVVSWVDGKIKLRHRRSPKPLSAHRFWGESLAPSDCSECQLTGKNEFSVTFDGTKPLGVAVSVAQLHRLRRAHFSRLVSHASDLKADFRLYSDTAPPAPHLLVCRNAYVLWETTFILKDINCRSK